MTIKLLGAEVVIAMNEHTANQAKELRAKNVIPTLAIVKVGMRDDAMAYAQGAIGRAEQVGVATKLLNLEQSTTTQELVRCIEVLNRDDTIHGILLLRPLPTHIDDEAARNSLLPAKDIDGITDSSIAAVFTGSTDGYAPCTAGATLEILDHYNLAIAKKNACVVGRSLVIGRPVAMMLLARDATVTIAHSKTNNLHKVVGEADIVVACVGSAGFLDRSYFSTGQVVIDVGINVTEKGLLVGDVDFDSAFDTVAAITPVPGGVGTVTTSVLVKHVVAATKRMLCA